MGRRVLVVDNNPAILKFFSNLLEKKGHQVSTAEDGLSALQMLEHDVPDIMFVDLVMPNISGDKLCRIVRADPKLKDVSLVVISAATREDGATPAKYDADACIAKGPFARMSKHILEVMEQLESGAGFDSPDKVLGIEDVYEREITKELLSVKNHFEVIFDNMSEGILELSPDSRVVFANRAAVSIFGVPEERLLNSCIADLFDEDERTKVESLMDPTVGGPLLTSEDSPVRYRDGELLLRFFQVDAKGDGSSIVILDDVTHRRREEREKRRVERKLEEQQALSMASDRLRSLGEMAAGIAHELSQPLVGVRGVAEHIMIAIERGWELTDEDICKKTRTIVEQSERMMHIIDHVRVFAKEAGTPDLEQVQVNDIVLYSIGLVGAQLRAREIRIEAELAEGLPSVMLNQYSLEEVILNLISNARDAIGEKKKKDPEFSETDILIRTRMDDDSPEGAGRHVIIEVVDRGIGVSAEVLPKVFDPFFTTKGPDRGTGLGLAVSKSIIEQVGGTLEIRSGPDRGTAAIITLMGINSPVV